MNYLVTGGAGFIGRWVVKRLLADTDAAVTVFDNFSNGRPENLAEFAGNASLKVVAGDVADERALGQVWKERGPFDVVLHLAAQVRVQDSIDHPVATFRSDVAGTLQVLECCRQQYFEANGLDVGRPFYLTEVQDRLRVQAPRLVFMSTCMVYDRASDRGIDESHATRAITPYGASKIAA